MLSQANFAKINISLILLLSLSFNFIEKFIVAYSSTRLNHGGRYFLISNFGSPRRNFENLYVYKTDSEFESGFIEIKKANSNNLSSSSLSNIAGTRKNLKKTTASPLLQKDDWNEVRGLSEKELLTGGELDSDSLERKALSLAYRRCEYVTKLFSKTFYMGTSLMRPEARQHVWAIYAWCRRTDDIVDSPRALLDRDSLSKDLTQWEQRLTDIWKGEPVDLFDLALADTVKTYPTLSSKPFKDMILGMIMDVPGLGQVEPDLTY